MRDSNRIRPVREKFAAILGGYRSHSEPQNRLKSLNSDVTPEKTPLSEQGFPKSGFVEDSRLLRRRLVRFLQQLLQLQPQRPPPLRPQLSPLRRSHAL